MHILIDNIPLLSGEKCIPKISKLQNKGGIKFNMHWHQLKRCPFSTRTEVDSHGVVIVLWRGRDRCGYTLGQRAYGLWTLSIKIFVKCTIGRKKEGYFFWGGGVDYWIKSCFFSTCYSVCTDYSYIAVLYDCNSDYSIIRQCSSLLSIFDCYNHFLPIIRLYMGSFS